MRWAGRPEELEIRTSPGRVEIYCPACKNRSAVSGIRPGEVVDFKVVHEDDCAWLAAREAHP